MAAHNFADNAITTLSGNVTNNQVTIPVVSNSLFPGSAPFSLLVGLVNATTGAITNGEYMLCTSGQSTLTWGVTRGYAGSTGVSHVTGESVIQIFLKEDLDSLNQGYWPYLQPGGAAPATGQTRLFGSIASGTVGSGTWSPADLIPFQNGRLGINTSGGTPGSWAYLWPQNLYTGRMTCTSAPTVNSGAVIPFNVVTFDPNSNCTTGASAKYTAPADGYYSVVGQCGANTSANYRVSMYVNGVEYSDGSWAGTATNFSNIADEVQLNAGDFVDLRPQGSNVTLNASGLYTYVAVSWKRPKVL